MKTVTPLILFLCFGPLLLAQKGNAALQNFRFYENLALRDAQYEQTLHTVDLQDEQDYWKDQRNYERQLGTENFAAYLVYMKGKKEAYQLHLQQCSEACSHSGRFFERAHEYLSISDTEYLRQLMEAEMVLNTPKKRNP
ncbi:hypothetical protein [Flagellimonas sp.]|uniref:hypothetical protein n=1 Tax=Flagellimonas sp. TaxID=2058762 RepID=UPI003BAB50FF